MINESATNKNQINNKVNEIAVNKQKDTLLYLKQVIIEKIRICIKYIFYKIFYFVKLDPKRNYGLDVARIYASILVLAIVLISCGTGNLDIY